MLYEEDRFHPNNDDDTWIDKLPKKKDLTMFLEPIKKYECIIPCKIGYKKIQLTMKEKKHLCKKLILLFQLLKKTFWKNLGINIQKQNKLYYW